ncbi:PREDICTED: TMV resistance [Prunus dulcis]|uniref:ADP-ribosyl cyclase/cyclic ADP-ribose hydrolase n=1 Tax=Prunus dulcis TaxID=3755 RepID=A0A5E4G173_PRUDU|nr:PREDICTED: TMV resistance [Prunus dulcis]
MALSTKRASSTSVPRAIQWKYDVFLSFSGEDTRKRFTAHLYEELKYLGIRTFLDNPELEIGKPMPAELSSAITESRLAIIVISPNYASSTWCLDELLQILQCMEARDTVLPIFYDLEPSDVRKQTGSLAKAFSDHEKRFDTNKLKDWKAALTKVANLTGWTAKDKDEPGLIKEIVQKVQTKVPPVFWESKKLVGIEPRLEQLYSLLDIDSDDVHFIGLCGMDGIGKTTIAKIARKTLGDKFDVSRFFSVKMVSEKHGLVNLQRRLCKSLMKKKSEYWDNIDEEATMINFLFQKKVLLILDDVDDISQLENLCGNRDWFGPGSRIIITTANEKLLITHGVKIFKVPELDANEAIQLFSLKAFKRDYPDKKFTALSRCFVDYANGLPLALEVLGSYLHTRDLHEWTSEWIKLKDTCSLNNDSSRKIMEVLKISYDRLDEEQKNIFLDIACFFKGKCKYQVLKILKSCGFQSDIGIKVLVEKSLITISDNMVLMHDLFQVLGQAIVVQQSKEPGGRSRLWRSRDIYPVLRDNTGTKSVEGIVLPFPESEEAKCNPEAFSQMSDLRILKIHNVHLPGGLKYLPDSLRFLEWRGYPEKDLPPDFEAHELVELSMCHSSIKQLWIGVKTFGKLKVIDLSHSLNLTRTPNCIGVQNLGRLDLEGCKSLVEIHPSVGALKKLTSLNVKNCTSLRILPAKIEMELLEAFILSGCSSLKRISEFVSPMENLREIFLDRTAIESIPSSIECLTSLSSFDMRGCKYLNCLPSTIGNLKSLKSLNVSSCPKLAKLPESFGELESLEEIDISETSIKEWPSSSFVLKNLKSLTFRGRKSGQRWFMSLRFLSWPMKRCQPMSSFMPPLSGLSSLMHLDLSDRNLLEGEMPMDIDCLTSLVSLNLSGNHFIILPERISRLSKLEILYLSGCKKLQHLPVLASDISLERVPYPEDRYEIIIPGRNIPWWFSYKNLGSSVSVKQRPQCSKNKWMGYAVCAVFEVSSSGWNVTCDLKVNGKEKYPAPLIATNVQPVGEHLWLFYVSRDISFDREWQNSCNQLTFSFTNSSCCFVKKCGVRLVYQKDVEDFDNVTTQSSIDISPYEAMDDKSASVHGATIKRSYSREGSSERGDVESDENYQFLEQLDTLSEGDIAILLTG